MNRTGLVVALAVALVVGLIFGLYPDLDVRLARLFFGMGNRGFGLRIDPLMMGIREAIIWFITAFAGLVAAALVIKLVLPQTRLLVPGRAVVFLLATLALGPGLFTNVLAKDHWGRPRPIDITEFGGDDRFVPWWDPRGGCPKNCSFVAGDPSGAFWMLAPAALAPTAWRPLAYSAALAFGAGVGLLRMSFGAHFFSDVVFSGVFTFLIIWLAHGLLYRWPRTRLTDDGVERGIERLVLPLHDALDAAISRVLGRPPRPRDQRMARRG